MKKKESRNILSEKQIPHFQVAAGIIQHEDNILISRRREESMLGGLWEFPGGKQENGETLKECLYRELQEELAIHVEVGDKYCTVKHAYKNFKITLHVFYCKYLSGSPETIGCAEWRWVKPAELDRFTFPSADRKVIDLLIHDNKTA